MVENSMRDNLSLKSDIVAVQLFSVKLKALIAFAPNNEKLNFSTSVRFQFLSIAVLNSLQNSILKMYLAHRKKNKLVYL